MGVSQPGGYEHRTQAQLFLISKIVFSSRGLGPCVLGQDTLPTLLCTSDGTLSNKSCRTAGEGKIIQNRGRVGLTPVFLFL